MKRIFYAYPLILSLFLLSFSSMAQKKKVYEAEGAVVEFASPYEKIVLMVDDEETEYSLNVNTRFGKKTSKEDFRFGLKVKIDYTLEGQDYLLKEIRLSSNKVDEKMTFKGLFEYVDNGIAYVDGKKVKLTDKGAVECTGKNMFGRNCGCEKVRPYKGIEDPAIKRGSFFSVKGKLDKDGIIQASQIDVCKNAVTDDEIELRALVENSYSTKSLVKVKAPKNTNFNAANGLYKGNIKIGDLEYKLCDDIRIQGYINTVGNRIIPEYAQDSSFLIQNNIVFRFYVIESPIPNAFAYPNGMVFVHTGLLKIMENEAQLALVLGHEIAHVLYEHSVERYKKNKLLGGAAANALFSVLVKKVGLDTKPGEENGNEGLSASFASLVDKFSPQNLSGLFEKRKETQADRIGLLYIYLAGYDLREGPKFWLKMKEVSGDVSFQQKISKSALGLLQSKSFTIDKNILSNLAGKGLEIIGGALLENIYASHPQAKQRYYDINELIATYYKDMDFSKAMVGSEDFKKYLSIIR